MVRLMVNILSRLPKTTMWVVLDRSVVMRLDPWGRTVPVIVLTNLEDPAQVAEGSGVLRVDASALTAFDSSTIALMLQAQRLAQAAEARVAEGRDDHRVVAGVVLGRQQQCAAHARLACIGGHEQVVQGEDGLRHHRAERAVRRRQDRRHVRRSARGESLVARAGRTGRRLARAAGRVRHVATGGPCRGLRQSPRRNWRTPP